MNSKGLCISKCQYGIYRKKIKHFLHLFYCYHRKDIDCFKYRFMCTKPGTNIHQNEINMISVSFGLAVEKNYAPKLTSWKANSNSGMSWRNYEINV